MGTAVINNNTKLVFLTFSKFRYGTIAILGLFFWKISSMNKTLSSSDSQPWPKRREKRRNQILLSCKRFSPIHHSLAFFYLSHFDQYCFLLWSSSTSKRVSLFFSATSLHCLIISRNKFMLLLIHYPAL